MVIATHPNMSNDLILFSIKVIINNLYLYYKQYAYSQNIKMYRY